MTKEESQAYHAAYYQSHRPELLARMREWKAKNKERHLASSIEWAKANPEKVREYKRRWKESHPEQVRLANVRGATGKAKHAARQRARNRAVARPTAEVSSFYIFVATADTAPCRWCGVDPGRGHREVDHLVPISRGGQHELGNLVVSCQPCNIRKGAMLPNEFVAKAGV